jgi:hypothetical protein
MTHEWITHRLPTEADANHDGDVKVPDVIGAVPPHGWYQHHTLVVPGQPWWSHRVAERAEVATPAPSLKSLTDDQLQTHSIAVQAEIMRRAVARQLIEAKRPGGLLG